MLSIVKILLHRVLPVDEHEESVALPSCGASKKRSAMIWRWWCTEFQTLRSRKKSIRLFPFMVRYPFDKLTVLSNVEGLTTNGKW